MQVCPGSDSVLSSPPLQPRPLLSPDADEAVGAGLHFEPLTRVVGSQVTGVRLSDADLSDATVAALRSQLLSRGVLTRTGGGDHEEPYYQ